LHDKWQMLGATLNSQSTPLNFAAVPDEVRILRKESGIVDRSGRGRIEVTGDDRIAFLQALFTNDVNRSCGESVYGFFRTAKGRMLADARISVLANRMLLDVEPQAKDTVLAFLEKYHFSEKFDFEDISEATAQIAVFGPRAP